jgi:hypothetical protein
VNRYQTLQITVQDEDEESLGSCSVDAADIIKEFVLAGAGFLHEIVKDKVRQQPPEVDEGVHIDDRDSVLGTQDILEPAAEEKHMSWDAIRASVIPSFVKDITFTITEELSTPSNLEQLQAHFPGVATVIDTVFAAGDRARKELEQEKARIHQEKAGLEQEKVRLGKWPRDNMTDVANST